MKKRHIAIVVFVLLAALCGCSHRSTSTTVYQVSTLQSLMLGNYEGAITAKELVRHGNSGLGTFDDLDGEMIVLDGKVYKAKYDGTVERVPDDETIPFANVAYMGGETEYILEFSGGYEGLKVMLDSLFPDENTPVIFRVDGTFEDLRYRSVPEQDETQPLPLVEVVKEQSEFEQARMSGTLVGFRFPAYLGEINAAGYHLHFLASDRQSGGHLLEVGSGSVTVTARRLDGISMLLPPTLANLDLTSVEESKVEQVESQQ